MKVDIFNTDKKYQIIYADPAWKYKDQKNNDPKMGGITYTVMELEDIKKLPVKNLADKDCALFMWVTMPMLKEGLEVIEAWGFKYITCGFTWVKQNPSGEGIYSGLGHWTNGNAELCLFAKKGKPKRVAKNIKQIVLAPRGRHSEKPPEVRQRIEELLGAKEHSLSMIELFSRHKIEGWDRWGNEAPEE